MQVRSMDKCSLLHPKIAFFYNTSNDTSEDVDKYFIVHKNTYNWKRFGDIFRTQLKVDSSRTPSSTDFGNLKYEHFRELVHRLHPVYIKSLSMQEKILNDLKNFQWLESNVEVLQVVNQAISEVGDTSNMEHILLLTAMLEYALGNVFYTKSEGKNPPHLLRDLLSTDELLEVFGWEAIWFLKILLGSPHAINLRNIVWHGFPQPAEMPQYYVAVLIVAINSLGVTLCEMDLQLAQRPQVVELTRYLEKIQKGLTHINNPLTTLNNALLNCSWLGAAHKTFWFQLLSYLEKKNWWQFVMLVLPQIELLLRLLYAQANDYDVRAKLDEYYITIDTMFETHVPNVNQTFNKLLLPGTRFIDESVLKLMYDLFIAPHGPRIRDKVSHGEVNLDCINNAQLCHILMQLSLQLIMPTQTSNSFAYESNFHVNSLTMQGIKTAKIYLLQLLQLPLPQNFQHVLNDQVKYLQNITFNAIKIFQRPKRETELMQLLLKIAQLLTQTCMNYSESVTERCLLLRQRELHSKRRRTLEKMLSTLPEICKTLCTVLCSTEDIFYNTQLVVDSENDLKDAEKTSKFLKQTLQIVENFSKYSAKDSNEWIKALELCKKFDANRCRYLKLNSNKLTNALSNTGGYSYFKIKNRAGLNETSLSNFPEILLFK